MSFREDSNNCAHEKTKPNHWTKFFLERIVELADRVTQESDTEET
jgi:hypothetical protein